MTTRTWIRKLCARTPSTVHKAPTRFRPRLEALEDRLAPSVSVAGPSATAQTGFQDGINSLSIPRFSVPSGTDRLLAVATGCEENTASVTSMTFGGQSLTKAVNTGL